MKKKIKKKPKKYYTKIIIRTEGYDSTETTMRGLTADEIDKLNDFVSKICKIPK